MPSITHILVVKLLSGGKSIREINQETGWGIRRLEEIRRKIRNNPNLQKEILATGVTCPQNDCSAWSARDLKRVTAPDRPSDEVLAEELGRSIRAIRAMRHRLRT